MRKTFFFLIVFNVAIVLNLNGFSQTIRIYTNDQTYRPADKIDVLLEVKNPGAESNVDILILFITPSGKFFWGMTWNEEFTIAAEKVLLPSGFDIANIRISQFDVPNSLPPIDINGQYILAAAFVKSGNLELIGTVSSTNFDVTGLPIPTITPTPEPTETPFLLSISENGSSDFSGFEDVYLDEEMPKQNRDTRHIQIMGNSPTTFKKVTLFRIDTANIPNDAVIIDAWIDLYLFLDKNYGTFYSMMYDMNPQSESGTGWIEDKATWYTYDGENPWTGGQDGGAQDEGNQVTISKLHTQDEEDGWFSYYFNDYGKSYIQSRVKNGDDLNIRFRTEEPNGLTRFSRIFFDSEVSNPSYRPVFNIKYIHNPEQTPQPTATATPTDPQSYTTVTFGLRSSDDFNGNWEDTWVYKYVYAQNTNYGSHKTLAWRNHESYTKYTHIKVDITELPDGLDIYSAKLYFYLYNHGTKECNVSVDSLIAPHKEDWLENKDTWISFNGINNWTNNNGGNDDRGENLGASTWSNVIGWHFIQFNSNGLQYLVEKSNTGLCSFIVGIDPQLGTKKDFKHDLYSSEWDDDTLRPYLQILYKGNGNPNKTPTLTPTPTTTPDGSYFLETIGTSNNQDHIGFADAMLDQKSPDMNFDGQGLSIRGSSEDNKAVSLFNIKTGNLPDNAVITSVKLYLYLSENGFETIEGQIYSLTFEPGMQWNEEESTWNNYTTGKSWAGGSDGAKSNEVRMISAKNHPKYEEIGWIIYDFNDDGIKFVQDNLEENGIINIRLRAKDTDGSDNIFRKFYDGEYSNELLRPYLEVKYYLPR